MDNTISSLIKEYHETKNDKYFKELLEHFYPLIRSYAQKLYYLDYDDSIQELSIALYESIRKINITDNEYACISYIKKSIINKFTKLYHNSMDEQQIRTNAVSLEISQNHISQYTQKTDDCIFKIDFLHVLKTKSPLKQKIFYLLILGYSDQEIAMELGYTSQYINRLKKDIWNLNITSSD